MKKTLVLALVLVMALTASSFAAVSFGGEFETKLTQTAEKLELKGNEFTYSNTLQLFVNGGDEGNWSFEGKLNANADKVELKEYKLSLTDEYFTLTAWQGRNHTWKDTNLNLVRGTRVGGAWALRAETTIADVKLTAQTKSDLGQLFADFKYAGQEFGLVAQTQYASEKNTFVAHGKFNAMDYATIKAAAGITTFEDAEDNLAYGIDVEVPVTEEVTLNAGYTEVKENFVGNLGETKELTAGVAYEVTNILAEASFTRDMLDEETVLEASAIYRGATNVSFANQFHADHWFKNKSYAAGVFATHTTPEAGDSVLKLEAKGSYPILADRAWALATVAKTIDVDGMDLSADLYVKATDKLTLKPAADYNTDSKVLTVGNVAEYAVGSATITLDLSQTTEPDVADVQKATFGVKVKF